MKRIVSETAIAVAALAAFIAVFLASAGQG